MDKSFKDHFRASGFNEDEVVKFTDYIMGNIIPTLKGNIWAGKMTKTIPLDDPDWGKAYEGEYAELWTAVYNAVINKVGNDEEWGG